MRYSADRLERSLSVPPLSDKIQQEKDFVEATSRITSFNVMSRPGIPISPLEIRLTKDRLSLISRVLGSTSDAYKYPEVILDLVAKLNLSSDPAAQVKALAMIADTAMQSEDFVRAHETSELMVSSILALESQGASASEVAAAREVCWIACLQLGRQPMFEDVGKKRALLARALEFCPPAQIGDVLAAFLALGRFVSRPTIVWIRVVSGCLGPNMQPRTCQSGPSAFVNSRW